MTSSEVADSNVTVWEGTDCEETVRKRLFVGLFGGLFEGLFAGLFEGLFAGLFAGLLAGQFAGLCACGKRNCVGQ